MKGRQKMENENKEEIKKPKIKYKEVKIEQKPHSRKKTLFILCILVAFVAGIIIALLFSNVTKNITTNEITDEYLKYTLKQKF